MFHVCYILDLWVYRESLKYFAVASALGLIVVLIVWPTALKLFPCIYTEIVFLQRCAYGLVFVVYAIQLSITVFLPVITRYFGVIAIARL